ncbi:MAG: hypothetical protein JNM09_04890 [Blastocatellia bacterium]|nr:hypothetical protein [Blastocatellia bacterium]
MSYLEADDDESSLVLITSVREQSQALFLRRLLDEAGVPSVMAGGHGDRVGTGEAYRIYVDEDWTEGAQETIDAFKSSSLVTGQIEGELARLRQELDRVEQESRSTSEPLQAVRTSLEKLMQDLHTFNRELE